MPRIALFLLALVAAALSGCAQPETHIGGKPRPMVIGAAVSIAPSASEILIQKAGKVQVLGLTAECNYPLANPPQPKVMNGSKPNYELIKQLNPQLIVYDVDLFSEDDIQKFKEMGMATFGFEGNTLEEFAKCLYRFGKLTGSETDIAEYVSSFQSAAELGNGSPLDPKPKVALIIPGEQSEHMVAAVGTLQADVLRAAGADAIGPEGHIFLPLNAEWLLSQNPDAVLIAGDSTSFEKDPRFQGIAAIKNKRFAHINADIALRRGTRIDVFVRDSRAWLMSTQPGAPKAEGE